MSRAIALVRFDDDIIMKACYNGTCDVLSPWLITEQDLDERFDSIIFAFDDWCFEHYNEIVKDPETITDSEHVEIYIDYGNGSMWRDCTASRTAMYITSETELCYVEDDEDEISQWVIDYHLKNRMSIEMFKGRIEQPKVGFTLISEEIISDEEYERNKTERIDENEKFIKRQGEILYDYLKSLGIRINM